MRYDKGTICKECGIYTTNIGRHKRRERCDIQHTRLQERIQLREAKVQERKERVQEGRENANKQE